MMNLINNIGIKDRKLAKFHKKKIQIFTKPFSVVLSSGFETISVRSLDIKIIKYGSVLAK